MNDNTDYAALTERLSRLACDLRGRNPDHVAEGQDRPAWQADDIQADIKRTLDILKGGA